MLHRFQKVNPFVVIACSAIGSCLLAIVLTDSFRVPSAFIWSVIVLNGLLCIDFVANRQKRTLRNGFLLVAWLSLVSVCAFIAFVQSDRHSLAAQGMFSLLFFLSPGELLAVAASAASAATSRTSTEQPKQFGLIRSNADRRLFSRIVTSSLVVAMCLAIHAFATCRFTDYPLLAIRQVESVGFHARVSSDGGLFIETRYQHESTDAELNQVIAILSSEGAITGDSLSGRKITENGVKSLQKIATLESLNVTDLHLTSTMIDAICGLRTLEDIFIDCETVPEEHILKIRAELPDCWIHGRGCNTR